MHMFIQKSMKITINDVSMYLKFLSYSLDKCMTTARMDIWKDRQGNNYMLHLLSSGSRKISQWQSCITKTLYLIG